MEKICVEIMVFTAQFKKNETETLFFLKKPSLVECPQISTPTSGVLFDSDICKKIFCECHILARTQDCPKLEASALGQSSSVMF